MPNSTQRVTIAKFVASTVKFKLLKMAENLFGSAQTAKTATNRNSMLLEERAGISDHNFGIKAEQQRFVIEFCTCNLNLKLK